MKAKLRRQEEELVIVKSLFGQFKVTDEGFRCFKSFSINVMINIYQKHIMFLYTFSKSKNTFHALNFLQAFLQF